MTTPEDQRRYRRERAALHDDAERALRDGGPFTLAKGQGQTLKLRGLRAYLIARGWMIDVDETDTEYVLIGEMNS